MVNTAQRLYTRLGFRPVEVTETHIYMEATEGILPGAKLGQ